MNSHPKKPCLFCKKEVRTDNLCYHIVKKCKAHLKAYCSKDPKLHMSYITLTLKDGSSLYCVLGINKSYVKQSLVTLFLKNCTEEDRANHRKALKELVNEETDIIDVSKEEPIIEAALSNEKEKEYLRIIFNLEKARRADEDQSRKDQHLLEVLKNQLIKKYKNEDEDDEDNVGYIFYEKCIDKADRSYEEEEQEDEIVIPLKSKKIIGSITFKGLEEQFK